MENSRARSILMLAALLGGCATDLRSGEIQSRPSLQPDQAPPPLQVGFVYNLPAAVVTPSGSIRVAGCPIDDDAKKALDAVKGQSAPAPIKGAVFAVSGDIAVEQVAGKQVLIDYRELGEFLKTSSIGLERHPNLMLKSVNVTIEDETPALIANAAIVAADIALFSVSPPAAIGATGVVATALKNRGAQPQSLDENPAPTDTVSYLACKPETVKLLEARKTARDSRDADTKSLDEANAALARLLRHADSGFTQAELSSIHSYRDKILDLTASIAEASDTIAKADTKLSLKLDVTDGMRTPDDIKNNGLPIDHIIADKVALASDATRIQAFVDRHFTTASAKVPAGVGAAFQIRECTKDPVPTCMSASTVPAVATQLATAKLEARKAIMPVDGYTPSFASPPKAQKKRSGTVHASQGIIYVEPARYSFALTQTTFPADVLVPTTTLKAVTASVPQLGTYLSLPVHAGFGEKVELKATFNTDGSLATASYGRPSSAGKALSATLAGLTSKAVSTQDAIAARKLALMKAEAERLTAQKSIVDAQDKLNPKADPLADLNAQIAIANANATLAEANVRLMVANAKLNGGQ